MNTPRPRAAPQDRNDWHSQDNGRELVLVRELTAGDRERLLAHFLALQSDDRLLRFGQAASDQVVENYVRTI
ncbi:MAG: GNAT family N-acetyltransferase, partial [Trinickia sp.]